MTVAQGLNDMSVAACFSHGLYLLHVGLFIFGAVNLLRDVYKFLGKLTYTS